MESDEKKSGSEQLETLEDSGENKPADTPKPGTQVKPATTSNNDSKVQKPSEQDKPEAVGPKSADHQSPQARLKDLSNLYLIIFVFVILAIIGTTAALLSRNNNSSKSGKNTSSLTSNQLAQLSGNTTIVGDARQTLDIQSDTIMEGQLLVRKDLSVAGSIKVGGSLSLSSVTVGGQGNFGQLQINGTLSVAGNTTFAGSVTVQKNLSVTGSLSASQINVTTLQFSGDLRLNRHVISTGSLPGRSNGAAIGAGGTSSVNGTDTAGTVTINTGSSPSAGSLVTVSFSSAFASAPHVVITPLSSIGAALQYYVSRTASGFTILSANAPPAGSSFSFDYIIID